MEAFNGETVNGFHQPIIFFADKQTEVNKGVKELNSDQVI